MTDMPRKQRIVQQETVNLGYKTVADLQNLSDDLAA